MAVDPLGLTIFLIGIAFIIAELAQPGYFLGVPGTTAVIMGLVQIGWPGFITGTVWSPVLVVIVALASFAASVEFYRRFAPAVKPPETLSSDGLIGKPGKVVEKVVPEELSGKVRVGGIVWSATGPNVYEAGTDVKVTKVDGVHLEVEAVKASPKV